MSAGVRRAWGAVALLCLFTSMAVSSRIVGMRSRPRGEGDPGTSAGVLVELSRRPALALGFRNVLADVVWLEAVQVAGNKKMTTGDYSRLTVLLNAVANYDPRFAIPYLLGGVVLGESPGHVRDALRILERGRSQFPDNWQFPFYIGFTYWFSLGDFAEGGKAMAAAARLPGSPAYLPTLATRLLAEGRDPATALALLVELERQETDDIRRDVLRRRIRDVVVERDIQFLERSVAEFRARTGKLPGALADLVIAGIVSKLPREPNGGSYVLQPDGSVRSDRVRERLKVFRRT